MNSKTIIEVFINLVPALMIAAVAYYFFKGHIENENRRRSFMLQKSLQKQALPIRLQAYERMVLFLERISPSKLLTRVNPTSSNKQDYESLLVASIQQEFEHNLTQQIYVTDECWNVILAAKNGTIQLIRKANMLEKVETSDKLREVILTDLMENEPPTKTALEFVKKEVSELW
jgi:hypothetical protein